MVEILWSQISTGAFRRLLAPLVEKPEYLCSEEIIMDDEFWKSAIENFTNTWGNENLLL